MTNVYSFGQKAWKGIDHLGKLDVDGRKVLTWILKKQGIKM
jgi:hypothetical protein